MTHRFLYEARIEFDAATDWYEAQQTGQGDDFLAEAFASVQRILGNPQMYARVRRCPAGRDIRVGPIDRYPYLLIYEPTATEVVILSVVHARSRSQRWRRRTP